MSEAIAPAIWTLAGVLALAAIAKLRDPEHASRALRTAGMLGGPATVRALGAGELAIAAWCLIAPGTGAMAALAAVYLAFAGAISRMRQAGVADCGCFGERSFEPSVAHLVLNLCAVVIAMAAVIAPPPDIGAITDRPPLEAIALGGGVATCVYLSYLAFTALPRAWGSYAGAREVR
jgi:hypothetical protein